MYLYIFFNYYVMYNEVISSY